jgi:micrococcal nuclease
VTRLRKLLIALVIIVIIGCLVVALLALFGPTIDERTTPTAASAAENQLGEITIPPDLEAPTPAATLPPPPPTEAAEPTAVALSTPASAAESKVQPIIVWGEEATVTGIIDGDTLEVDINGVGYRVRYIGMDAPEEDQPLFDEATEANRLLVEGQIVTMNKDVTETDRFGRLLRYVYLGDGTFVNGELVRQGYAQEAAFPPDVAQQELLLQLQLEARESGRGLWGQTAEPTRPPAADPP